MRIVTAVIKRSEGGEIVRGKLVAETSTFCLLKKEPDSGGVGVLEWFAKAGPRVSCEIKEES